MSGLTRLAKLLQNSFIITVNHNQFLSMYMILYSNMHFSRTLFEFGKICKLVQIMVTDSLPNGKENEKHVYD